MNSLYIHIPFCQSKCLYCSFTSFSNQQQNQARYVKALLQELQHIPSQLVGSSLSTVFIGGGTPTILSGEELDRVLETVNKLINHNKSIELTIEANPESVSRKVLKQLWNQGVNRISFGVQTFQDDQLLKLGRVHNSAQAREAVKLARESGFTNISVDLMYGLPGQTVEQHQYNLEMAFSLPITHLSVYELTVEENTLLAAKYKKGELLLPSEEEIEIMEAITLQQCENKKFMRYEISNYALDGYQCQHNITYWKNREYIGVGASAVSYLNGKRTKNDSDLLRYCRRIEATGSAVIENETLAKDKSIKESVIIGLRMLEGVSRQEMYERYGVDLLVFYGETVVRLMESNLLDWDETRMFLTPKGLRFANRVMAELV